MNTISLQGNTVSTKPSMHSRHEKLSRRPSLSVQSSMSSIKTSLSRPQSSLSINDNSRSVSRPQTSGGSRENLRSGSSLRRSSSMNLAKSRKRDLEFSVSQVKSEIELELAGNTAKLSLNPIDLELNFESIPTQLQSRNGLSPASGYWDSRASLPCNTLMASETDIMAPRSTRERDLDPERLNISSKNLTFCPLLQSETALKMLNMQNNYIASLENLEPCVNLVFLDIFNNQITSLEAIRHLSSLRVLLAGSNRISSIIPVSCLVQLDVLDLSSNQISILPEGTFSNLKHLKVLNLESNCIASILFEFSAPKLADLNLNRNLIEKIDCPLGLPSLQKLKLSQNRLKSIGAIFALPQLFDLTIEENPVGEDPLFRMEVISKCKNLKIFNFKRILEEDKRSAIRGLKKRDAERIKKINDVGTQLDKSTIIQSIEDSWNSGAQDGANDDPNSVLEFIDAPNIVNNYESPIDDNEVESGPPKYYVELSGDSLNIFGNAIAAFPKLEGKQVNSVNISFVDADLYFPELVQRLSVTFAGLTVLNLGPVRLSKLNHIKQLGERLDLKQLTISEENSITSLAIYRQFTIYAFNYLVTLDGKLILEGERTSARAKFGHFSGILDAKLFRLGNIYESSPEYCFTDGSYDQMNYCSSHNGQMNRLKTRDVQIDEEIDEAVLEAKHNCMLKSLLQAEFKKYVLEQVAAATQSLNK